MKHSHPILIFRNRWISLRPKASTPSLSNQTCLGKIAPQPQRYSGPALAHNSLTRWKPDADAWRLICLALMVFTGCQNADQSETEPVKPAKVEKLPVETDLATITLTEDADRRLGITTVAVIERDVTRRRTLGGQVVVPSGKTIIVTAPLAGIVTPPENGSLPTPGSKVDSGTPLLSLKPLLSAERDVMTPAEQVQLVGARANLMAAQTVAAGDVDRGNAEVEGAQIAFDRATQLLADRAGARRAVDDSEALLNVAKANLAAAKERESQLSDLLKMLDVQSPDGEATVLPMTTPISGLVNRIDVSVGQTIAAGASLFEVVNLDTIWIRVPVFVDQLREVQQDQDARLVSLSGEPLGSRAVLNPPFGRVERSEGTAIMESAGSPPRPEAGRPFQRESETDVPAKPIAAPPTADTMTSSADLYYEVDNRDLRLRPGQRIGVELSMSKSETSLIVPGGAILYDVYGNTWVYVETGERQYTRRRVAIRFVDGTEAILSTGPETGTPVVVDGSAELFGTEFGAGK